MAAPAILKIDVIADTARAVRGLNDVGGAAQKQSSSFRRMGMAIAGAVSVTAVVAFGKAAVTAASEDAEAQAQLAAALANTTGATDTQIKAAEEYIASLSEQTALADDELRPALATLARGFGDTEDAQRALALATDISAGSGKDLATVTEAMMKAAQGNTGALGRLGIATKDAAGEALTMEQIMAQAAQTFSGQASVAADTTAGKMRGATIAFSELTEQVGSYLLPVVAALAGFMTDNIGWVLPLAAALGVLGVAVLAVSAASSVATAATTAWTVAQAALNLVLSLNPIGIVVIAIAALVAGLILAYKKSETFRKIVDAAFRAVANVAKAVFGAITAAAQAAFNWLKANWPLILGILGGPFGLAVVAIVKNWDKIKTGITAVIDWIRDKFNGLTNFFSGLVSTIGGLVTSIVNALKAPLNAIIGAWNNLSITFPRVEIPDWVPGIGGKGFGGNTIHFPNIPTLAAGGVLTRPTLFIGGEAGRELVTPEKLLRQILRQEGGGNYTLNMYPQRADPAEVAWAFRRLELQRTGR